MRSRNMSAVIIVQNLIQLKRKFPKYDMDKDLIGNCAIIDILGAPDMDSCEYLSKHFGTQTIHKASDSDAKDYKGQSSRSEDVMEKSLLSAEDIFAMKKDGECAIVVKGTDPLFQRKCQMENTPFVKLLCRKHTPYDPAKKMRERKQKRQDDKNFFLSGKDAKEEAEKLRENGETIIRLTMDDAEDLIRAYTIGEEIEKLPIMAKDKELLEANYEKYLKAHQADKGFDFSVFGEASPDKYREYVILVQKLTNAGYSSGQITNLVPLIKEGFGFDEIEAFFSNDHSEEAIEKFTKEVCR